MRIKLFSKETLSISSSDFLKKKYEACCKGTTEKGLGPTEGTTEEEVVLVGEMDEDPSFTHAIILGEVMPDLPDEVPRENVVGMSDSVQPAFSPEFLEYAKRSISRYFVGSTAGLEDYPFFVARPSLLWFTAPKKAIREKTEIMSLAVPNTMQLHHRTKPAQGFMYTNQIIDCIIKNNIPIDIYGAWGLMHQKTNLFFTRVKGSYTNPLEPFEKYAFTIAIEDSPSPHYYSVEKIVHPLLNSCVPLYLGCEHIAQYFDPTAVMQLTGNLARDMDTIVKVLKTPERFFRKTDLDPEKIDAHVNLLRRCAVAGDIFPSGPALSD